MSFFLLTALAVLLAFAFTLFLTVGFRSSSASFDARTSDLPQLTVFWVVSFSNPHNNLSRNASFNKLPNAQCSDNGKFTQSHLVSGCGYGNEIVQRLPTVCVPDAFPALHIVVQNVFWARKSGAVNIRSSS